MSCCPTAPAIKIGAAGDPPTGIADNQPLPGESAECFMATATNPTQQHDDATGNVPNKIETLHVNLTADAKVRTTFQLQASSTRLPTFWEMKDDSGATPSWAGVTFTSNGQTALLNGQFTEADFGKKIRITVAAKDAAGEIDNKGYVFSPAKSTGSDSIQFVHPLPGAIVTSRFDLQRLHPVHKIIKPHNGADFALPGRKIGDVLCAADGEVIFVGYEAKGAGNYVKIKHLNTSGKHLCTTVYMHMAQVYVAVGQRLSAGQKVGLEGNTGIGTGAHLHFECRLPNDTRIDPVPLIRGTIQVARETNDDNTAKEESIEPSNQNAVLTPANVDAKQAGCKPYGAEYPTPTTAETPPAPAPSGGQDVFWYAWDLTMKTEVTKWIITDPTDPETLAGLIETKDQRLKTGWVDHPSDPGGKTKFGIASRYNKEIKPELITYEQAKAAGYSKYWQKSPAFQFATSKPKSAVAAFNLGFLCGNGGLGTILSRSDKSGDDLATMNSIVDQARIYLTGLARGSSKLGVFENGWMNRCEKVRAYAKAVPLPL